MTTKIDGLKFKTDDRWLLIDDRIVIDMVKITAVQLMPSRVNILLSGADAVKIIIEDCDRLSKVFDYVQNAWRQYIQKEMKL